MLAPSLLPRLFKVSWRAVTHILALGFLLLSLLIRRAPNLWIFGCWYGTRFADNPRYFFVYCSTLKECPITPVWISRRRAIVREVRRLGLRAYHALSPLGIWYRLRAGMYVVDCRIRDIGRVAPRGAVIVNLWHGVPLKRIERDIEQVHHPVRQAHHGSPLMRLAYRIVHPEFTERYDRVLATSPLVAARLSSAFGVPEDQVIVAGYPRTDPLFAEVLDDRHLLRVERTLLQQLRAHRQAGRRVLLYMPTFRDWRNVADRVIPIDWEALNHALMVGQGVLYCKLHPSDQARLPSLAHLENVRFVPARVDIYSVLLETDALISDYSSIYFDYLLLDRPIIFYPYDLEDYQRFSRTLYEPYESATPGPKARSSAELVQLVTRLLGNYDEMAWEWAACRNEIRERMFAFRDGHASERLLAYLLKDH